MSTHTSPLFSYNFISICLSNSSPYSIIRYSPGKRRLIIPKHNNMKTSIVNSAVVALCLTAPAFAKKKKAAAGSSTSTAGNKIETTYKFDKCARFSPFDERE